jgi:hypothetical protein
MVNEKRREMKKEGGGVLYTAFQRMGPTKEERENRGKREEARCSLYFVGTKVKGGGGTVED